MKIPWDTSAKGPTKYDPISLPVVWVTSLLLFAYLVIRKCAPPTHPVTLPPVYNVCKYVTTCVNSNFIKNGFSASSSNPLLYNSLKMGILLITNIIISNKLWWYF